MRARSRFTSALSVAAPISSERIGRKWHTEGIQSLGSPGAPLVESASKCTAQAFCKPEREVAGCVRKFFFYCIDRIPQPQFGRNRHKEAGKLVLYGLQRDGKFSVESCGHQPAPLSAPQWCRSCQRSLGLPGKRASKPCFIFSIQLPQEVAIVCPHREFEELQRDAVDQVLQAVKVHRQECPWTELGAG